MNAPDRLGLQGALTIVGARAQRERLMTLLDGGPRDVELDLAGVDAMDSAGLQLLLALRRGLESRGASLGLAGAPPVVREVLATCGLQRLLAAAAAAPAAPEERP